MCTCACLPAQIESERKPKQKPLELKIPKGATKGDYDDLILD